jgi:hypothetical protein
VSGVLQRVRFTVRSNANRAEKNIAKCLKLHQ